ncbi:glutamate racemase [Secundilactobacillus odoratitofui DSM 19909 = JCM 15043]|uniref:Glutamate racemase n=1 Tax=Secundilactobacillus odoratitofui DSM 19909 = JCM 15043 TaxID=1423776 RepID=A0A0R1LN93_9LACO|nr:glutamate racemase [Secundilactobacillus odoratitofui]KRK97247.1 glutamate racemase [Secundilactobacillus odoratitofui DSM 19909 = JCM 15043]
MKSQPIGFLDSGIGGLTVVKEALRQLPNESIVYLGDQARLPYGPRPASEVAHFVQQITGFLLAQNVKAIVIACNTATAAALPILQAKLSIPVVGVIDSGSQSAVAMSQAQQIGVIATAGTISSHAYHRAITKLSPQATISGLACPEFVTIVENNQAETPETAKTVAEKLSYFKPGQIDTLILGCTHFPLLQPAIEAAVGPNVQLVDSGVETVTKIKQLLTDQKLLAPSNHVASHAFYTTGATAPFDEIAANWLQLPGLTAKHIAVDGLVAYGDLEEGEPTDEA